MKILLFSIVSNTLHVWCMYICISNCISFETINIIIIIITIKEKP